MIRYIFPVTLATLAACVMALIFLLPTPNESQITQPMPVTSDVKKTISRVTTIKNVRLVVAGVLSEPTSILLKNGVIENIGKDLTPPDGSALIEGEGATALPGLIDSHTHTYGSGLADALRFGVTTSLDMFTDAALLPSTRAARVLKDETLNSDLFSAGMMASVPGGHGTQFGVTIVTLTTLEEAPAWVAARKAEGSDYIKLAYIPDQPSFPSLDRPTAAALIKAAHDQGLMAVAHISAHDAARDMIEDGIDGLVHIFADKDASEEIVTLAKQKGIFIIPTLAVIAAIDGATDIDALAERANVAPYLGSFQKQTIKARFPGNYPGYSSAIASRNVKRFHDAGVLILAGSDAPNPGTAQGVSLHDEMQMLVAAGLTGAEALEAATRIPAEIFSLEGRGTLSVGARADILLVQGDPTIDISNTLDITHILKNGYVVSRDTAAEEVAQALQAGLLADFESSLNGDDGFMWEVSSDAMINGKSTAKLTRIEGGAGGSGYALRVDMDVNPGFFYPWAGASIGANGPINLFNFSALRFDVKGMPGKYRVMAFSTNAAGVPPTKEFEVSSENEWQEVRVSLSELDGFDKTNFVAFAFVAGPAAGESTFVLDNIELLR